MEEKCTIQQKKIGMNFKLSARNIHYGEYFHLSKSNFLQHNKSICRISLESFLQVALRKSNFTYFVNSYLVYKQDFFTNHMTCVVNATI